MQADIIHCCLQEKAVTCVVQRRAAAVSGTQVTTDVLMVLEHALLVRMLGHAVCTTVIDMMRPILNYQ